MTLTSNFSINMHFHNPRCLEFGYQSGGATIMKKVMARGTFVDIFEFCDYLLWYYEMILE